MSDWIKTDTAIYRRDKISGVRIYKVGLYRVEVLIEGGWYCYYAREDVSSRDEAAVEAARASAWEVFRRLCAELE